MSPLDVAGNFVSHILEHARILQPATRWIETANAGSGSGAYLVAVLLTALGVGAQASLAPSLGEEIPLLVLVLPVIASAMLGGFGPGLLATGMSAASAAFFVFRPGGSFLITDPGDRLRLSLFLAIGLITSLLGGSVQRALRSSRESALALRKSEERFRLAADAVLGVVYDWNVGTGEVFRSAGLRRLIGLYPEDAPASRAWWTDRIHPEDRPHILDTWGELMAGENDWYSHEYRVRHEDGRWVDVWDRGYIIRDGQGRPVRVVGSSADISERKQAETALREADRRKDEFLAMLAHELRNPLAPIRNAVEILNMTAPGAPPVQRARDTIGRQVKHMARLVDDLLDASRIARGKILLHKQRCDLATIVRQTAEDYRPTLEGRGLALEVAVPDHPLRVHGDPTRLAQILSNLLSNAAKFTEAGEVAVALRADANGAALLSVRDTGIGMDAEIRARLFEPFSQADHSLDRTRGGLGLGLNLVKGLAELHGGSVQAFSPGPGQGAEIVVHLPLAEAPDAEVEATLVGKGFATTKS